MLLVLPGDLVLAKPFNLYIQDISTYCVSLRARFLTWRIVWTLLIAFQISEQGLPFEFYFALSFLFSLFHGSQSTISILFHYHNHIFYDIILKIRLITIYNTELISPRRHILYARRTCVIVFCLRSRIIGFVVNQNEKIYKQILRVMIYFHLIKQI